MSDNPQVVIVTQSTVFTRVVPRILDYPARWDLRIVPSIPEAESYYRTSPTILVVDLRTGAEGMSHLLRGLVNNQIPPTLLTGEPWHVPPWIRDRLSRQLVFIAHPINPPKINAALKELIPLLDNFQPGPPPDLGVKPEQKADPGIRRETTPLEELLRLETPTDQEVEAADQLDKGPSVEDDSPDLLVAKLEEFLGEDDL